MVCRRWYGVLVARGTRHAQRHKLPIVLLRRAHERLSSLLSYWHTVSDTGDWPRQWPLRLIAAIVHYAWPSCIACTANCSCMDRFSACLCAVAINCKLSQRRCICDHKKEIEKGMEEEREKHWHVTVPLGKSLSPRAPNCEPPGHRGRADGAWLARSLLSFLFLRLSRFQFASYFAACLLSTSSFSSSHQPSPSCLAVGALFPMASVHFHFAQWHSRPFALHNRAD